MDVCVCMCGLSVALDNAQWDKQLSMKQRRKQTEKLSLKNSFDQTLFFLYGVRKF